MGSGCSETGLSQKAEGNRWARMPRRGPTSPISSISSSTRGRLGAREEGGVEGGLAGGKGRQMGTAGVGAKASISMAPVVEGGLLRHHRDSVAREWATRLEAPEGGGLSGRDGSAKERWAP